MLLAQFLVFTVVGGLSTACHFAVLIALHEFFRVPVVPATTVGALVGGLVSYTLNRTYTFARSRPAANAVSRFALVATGGLVINSASMAVLEHLLPLVPYLIRQCAVTGAVVAYSFLANKYWTFKDAAATRHI